jgi:fatty-acyl-CoA synthase
VGIWSQNCAEWLLSQLATAKAGLVSDYISILNEAAQSEALPMPKQVIRLGEAATPGMLSFNKLLQQSSGQATTA